MAKQKVLQQLDLFSGFFSQELVSENKETQEEKNSIINEVPKNNVVFSDDKIAVKIKIKQQKEGVQKAIINEDSVKKVVAVKETSALKISEAKKTKQRLENKSKRGRKSYKEMDAELETVNVPDEATLKQKLYYPIRDVAAFFNVNTSLIRAWETEFDILQPRKNRKGDRLFRVEDIKNLQVIYYLLRNKKFSIDGAKKYLKENKGKADTNQQIVQSLTKFRAFLVEMKTNLQA